MNRWVVMSRAGVTICDTAEDAIVEARTTHRLGQRGVRVVTIVPWDDVWQADEHPSRKGRKP